MYFPLLNIINAKYNHRLREVTVPLIQVVGIYKQMTLLVRHQVSSEFVTLLKSTYDYVSNILILIICCDLINSVSQILLCSCNVYQLHVIHCSYYFQLLGSDTVTTSICPEFKNYHKNEQCHLL
jgi:hypothetical protein